jgi:glycine/betaine/sarcosine/D-proline reductase family selenoprotein B
MLLRKIGSEPYPTEIPVPQYDAVEPAPHIKDHSQANLALVTESGLGPRGNPDGLISVRTTKWLKYNAKDGRSLAPTLTFGIPGSEATAILLGAFLIHGVRPGPEIL